MASAAVLLALAFSSLLFRDLLIGLAAGVLSIVIFAEAAWNTVVARSPDKRVRLVPEQAEMGPGKVVLYPGDESTRTVQLVKGIGGRVELGSMVNFQSVSPSSVSGKGGRTPIELRFSTPYAGEYVGERISLGVSGPLGLFSSETSIPFHQEYVVFPRTLQVAMGTLRLLGRGELGETPVGIPGIGTEFYQMRGYQPGDDYRDVNWKATARGGGVVVSEHMREVGGGYLLVLDTRAAGFADRDSLASTFLSLANALASSGVGFEVLVHDGEKITSATAGDGPRSALELALKAALGETRLEVGREVLELALSRQKVSLPYGSDQVLSQLLAIRRARGEDLAHGVDPWSAILERVRERSTRNVVWVSGLFGDVAPLMELAWQAERLHDVEFAVADPCPWDGATGSEGPRASLQEALSSAGVRLFYGKPLVIAQRIVSA